jgi:hypothetical protein
MRGDGDEAMSEGTAIPLLERIVADQRAIIADGHRPPGERDPAAVGALQGSAGLLRRRMQVPDDVTLLFADDNWARSVACRPSAPRRAPAATASTTLRLRRRAAQLQVARHRQIEKTWQQMDLAWQRGARTIWIVNVGDIKPEEFPLSFFMAQAWNPAAMDLAALERFPADWARAAFGPGAGAAHRRDPHALRPARGAPQARAG